MASWLTRLSVAFVVAGAAGATFVALHGRGAARLSADAAKIRPAFNEFVDQGQVALRELIDSADKRQASAEPLAQRAKLPFIVIEPRDFAAPIIRLPSLQTKPSAQLAQAAPPPQQPRELQLSAGNSGLDLNPVEARIRARVPAEVAQYFDLFLYVSKATPDRGEWAQRMFVLAKQQDQTYGLMHHWKVSTGREEAMPSPTGKMLGTETPPGMFKLDRGRSYADYTSRQWQSPMPFVMFFDWRIDGRPSGLAIHGTDTEGEKELGTRASHGCIRLSTDNAKTLFYLVRDNYRGKVPVFQINQETGTMSTTGALVRDENGRVKTTNGYKVLVFIEDYGGPSADTVAALY
ncbi:MAG: L,D-transpeptidase family protein [Hyphomicrobium aestuarii]|jgi:hypothetical protein|nr:L,D-transpeptidase family protein [Hyphomicrobium aestuarii]